ncbi:MAG: RelA/SpoT family protein [Chloroflexota bacterium]
MTTTHISPDGATFFDLINTYLGAEDRRHVREAFELARQEHGDERRKSGELFFTHPLTIAYYLAQYHLDAPALMAALLHDVVEDTRVSVDEITARFGSEVGRLVDGLTKFERVTDDAAEQTLSREEERDATLHKLFGVMTDDVRVGIIKIFDRLHNMRTIKATSQSTQERKAEETLAVYAPLANRLGMWDVKNDLEALSLEVLDPDAYHYIRQRLEQLRHQHQLTFSKISHEIAEHLTRADISVVDIRLSPENIYTVYQSSRPNRRRRNRFKIDSTLRLAVVVDDIPSCYLALGEIHQMWRPVPGTFDDYIATPRDNLYRALHTTVVHSSGQRIKVRFRTAAMNVLSEIGVLARWVRLGVPLWSSEIADRVDALVDNISETINLEPQDPRVGVQGVVQDVFRDQIMVYTPAGDVKELPQGATPLDFAYMIHSEVGDQCRVALVNDQPASLNEPLQSGDRVQIVKRGSAPQRIWLDEDLGYLTTNRARAHVRRWFRRLSEEAAVREGRRLLENELSMLGMADFPHEQVATLLEQESVTDLYHTLGRAELLPTTVSTQVLEQSWDQVPCHYIGSTVRAEDGEEFIINNAGSRPLQLCRTCQPRPDDRIIGFARRDGRITVHKEECARIPLDPLSDRTLKLEWGTEETSEVRRFTAQVETYDRPGLLFEITELLQGEGINLPMVYAETNNDHATLVLDLEVTTARQLVRVLHRIQALVNVYSVRSVPPGERVAPNGALGDGARTESEYSESMSGACCGDGDTQDT